jgi:uncharacterized membrane protein YhhN
MKPRRLPNPRAAMKQRPGAPRPVSWDALRVPELPVLAAPAAAATAGILVHLHGRLTGRDLPRISGKLAASVALLAAGLLAGLPARGSAGVAASLALLLSAIGDAFLLGRGTAPFVAGTVAFLLAHAAYGAGFLALGVGPAGVAAAVLPVAAIAALTFRWLLPHAGRLRTPLVAYVAAISAMLALAGGVVAAAPLLGAAALLFAASDLLVARERFVTKQFLNPA